MIVAVLPARVMQATKRIKIGHDVCVRPVCPWCILGATRGDLADAQLREQKLLDELCASSENVAGSQTIHFAARWCEELGEGSAALTIFSKKDVGGQDLRPEVTPDVESSASSSSNLGIVPYAQAAPLGAIPSVDTSAHTESTHIVPQPSEAKELEDDEFSAASCSDGVGYCVWTGQPKKPEPPPPAGASASSADLKWQVWGGRKTQWITYDEQVQGLLDRSWRTGETVLVTIQGYQYTINAQQGWQNREDTDAPVRQVRRGCDKGWHV